MYVKLLCMAMSMNFQPFSSQVDGIYIGELMLHRGETENYKTFDITLSLISHFGGKKRKTKRIFENS